MNTTISEAFEADLATVEAEIDNSAATPGWGSDLRCGEDLTEDFEELAPDDPLTVALHCFRGLNTDGEEGELADDPDWGIDLEKELSRGMTPNQIRDIETRIRGQVCRDDRLTNVQIVTRWAAATEELSIEISADIVDSDNDFSLTVVVSRTGTNLLEVLRNGRPVS
jgi:hypothetical protein